MSGWKFASRIIPHAGWEMFVMRAGFAALLFLSLPTNLNLTAQPHPVGLAHWLDLTWLSIPGVWEWLRVGTLVALVFYVIGVAALPALGWITLVSVAVGTLENSQGAINHSTQPIALIALAQFLVLFVRLVRNPGSHSWLRPLDPDTQRILLHTLKVVFLACYVTSAITKIDRTDGKWMWMTPNLAVQIEKTNADHYYTTGQAPDEWSKELPGLMEQHPMLTRLIVGPALLLELLAFLALIGRVPSLLMGIALILMHEGIAVLMELHFGLWQWLLFLILVNPLYWVKECWQWSRNRPSLSK